MYRVALAFSLMLQIHDPWHNIVADDWVKNLKSGKGPCCSYADGYVMQDIDWKSDHGHYMVHIPKMGVIIPGQDQVWEWIDVPDEAVINEPNRIGRTMVWPYKTPTGVVIRCFLPGPMG